MTAERDGNEVGHLMFDPCRIRLRRATESDPWHVSRGLAVWPRSAGDAVLFVITLLIGVLIVLAAVTSARIEEGGLKATLGILVLGAYALATGWRGSLTAFSSKNRMMLLAGEVYLVIGIALATVVGTRLLFHI